MWILQTFRRMASHIYFVCIRCRTTMICCSHFFFLARCVRYCCFSFSSVRICFDWSFWHCCSLYTYMHDILLPSVIVHLPLHPHRDFVLLFYFNVFTFYSLHSPRLSSTGHGTQDMTTGGCTQYNHNISYTKQTVCATTSNGKTHTDIIRYYIHRK